MVMAVVALVTACVTADEFAPKQRNQIESYLGDKEYRLTPDSAYVYLAGNKFDIAPENRRQGAEVGDVVTFNVEAYTFSGSSPSTVPYYTNKPYMLDLLSEDLDTSYWPLEPFVARLGQGDILKPLEQSFEGCVEGDSLLVFLTSSIAYGTAGMGAVPKNTPVMMILTVEQLEEK